MAQCTKKVAPISEIDNKNGSISYLALGDSYTIGERVATDERWPVQLVEKLQANNIAINSPQIIAKTGWTTAELDNGINAVNPQNTYDLVSLLIGVNNQYRGLSSASFKPEFEALLTRAIGFAGGNKSKVFVVSIPDYGVTPFGQKGEPEKIAKQIDEYNKIQEDICAARGIVYFDITPISRNAKTDLGLVAEDGLHPSAKMYGQWVDLMLNDVLSLVKP
ncbi:lysophospholipase [Arcticibacterium luteifluviistationis]|uniref:Lysophospholipase n=2 Tax=Arcticibacterium luteifluviistationis TaxID=1784714 RepID=A0A2Z4GC57_9BACT|nr:lysophospholipase [Arcticibacterium luteifluviistationis]